MSKLKGTIYVAIGAASYGILATFVKIAGAEGNSTGSITFTQFATGALVLFILDFFSGTPAVKVKGNTKDALRLMAAGTSLGLTSTFYYLSVKYLPVSVCIILLMQTIWMGILVDCIKQKKRPVATEIIAIIIVLGGTLLATGFTTTARFNWHPYGLLFGLLAAVSYTFAMIASNGVAVNRHVLFRSKYLVLGGLTAIVIFWNVHIFDSLSWHLEWRFGLLLGLFGTILPPILFSKGFPILGLGWGSVLAAIEIPVSVGTAYFLLNEHITAMQLVGCVCIIAGIVFHNIRFLKLS